MVGLRSRGTDHVRMFAANPAAEVVAVCDIDDADVREALEGRREDRGNAPRTEKDFRRLLDDKSIDAITIATPDHWHALLTVLACQAGKDVYVEKPASHNVVEGRRMVEAARKYNRVVQLGTQRRSTPHVKDAIARVRSGGIGKVGMARAWIHQATEDDRPRQAWTGARRRRLRDVARPRPRPPVLSQPLPLQLALVLELGHRRARQQRHSRRRRRPLGPRRRCARSPSAPAAASTSSMTTRKCPTPRSSPGSSPAPASSGNIGCGPSTDRRKRLRHRLLRRQGNHDHRRQRLADRRRRRLRGQAPPPRASAQHVQNFLDCVKSREKPNAEIEIGHLSTRLCHLGNIAFRVGKKLTFDAATESFHEPEADALLSREYSSRFEMPVAGLKMPSSLEAVRVRRSRAD